MAKAALKEAIARAEAEAEEPETPDTETPDGEEEAEPEPEPAPPVEPPTLPEALSDAEMEKRLVKALTGFEKAIRAATGTDEPLQPSPYPWVYGFVVPGEPSYQANPAFASCPVCNGLGDVLTGSRKQSYETQPCPRCGGRGYLDALPAGPPVAAVAAESHDTNGGQTTYGTPSWMGDPTVGGPRY